MPRSVQRSSNTLLAFAGIGLLAALIFALPAHAAPKTSISSLVGIGDPTNPATQQACVNASGQLCTGSDGVSDAANISASAAAAGVLTGTPFATAGYAVVDLDVQTMTATSITPQASFDGGATYRTVQCWSMNPSATAATVSITATGQWECPAGDHFELTQVGSGSTSVKLALKRAITAGGNQVSIGLGNTAALVAAPADAANGKNGVYANGQLLLFNGATWDRQYYCNKSATVSVLAGATTQVIALSGSTVIRICGFVVSMATTGTWSITSGTGTNCASNIVALTGTMNDIAGTPFAAYGNPEIARAASGSEVCFVATTGNLNGIVTYAQY